MTKVGMIGLGGMGGHHARILKEMDNVQIVAVLHEFEHLTRRESDCAGFIQARRTHRYRHVVWRAIQIRSQIAKIGVIGVPYLIMIFPVVK